jgi:hypothetical protein
LEPWFLGIIEDRRKINNPRNGPMATALLAKELSQRVSQEFEHIQIDALIK